MVKQEGRTLDAPDKVVGKPERQVSKPSGCQSI